MENAQSNQDLPIPVKQVVEVDVAFEGNSLDEQDKAWQCNMAFDLMKHCWPDFIDMLAKVNPSVSFSVRFVNSFVESTKIFIGKADELHSVLVTQPRAVVSTHPSKGSQKVEFTLNVYWHMDPPPAKRTAILLNDSTRRVVPDNAA
jgi:hypothetical protein